MLVCFIYSINLFLCCIFWNCKILLLMTPLLRRRRISTAFGFISLLPSVSRYLLGDWTISSPILRWGQALPHHEFHMICTDFITISNKDLGRMS
nr:MAG TPA: hypothetical protein [Caudoviricetes sp.]